MGYKRRSSDVDGARLLSVVLSKDLCSCNGVWGIAMDAAVTQSPMASEAGPLCWADCGGRTSREKTVLPSPRGVHGG